MTRFSHFLIVGLSVSSILLNVEAATLQTDPISSNSPCGSRKSYVRISFAGATQTYMDVGTCQFSKLHGIDCWYVRVGSARENYLSIAVCSPSEGDFSFGSGSLITYSAGERIYSSHYVPDNYLLLDGAVHLDQYEANSQVQGSFNGTLIPRHTTQSQANVVPITGCFRLCIS
ncbi:hypothetical protein [Spirosoma flavus]